MRLVIIESPYAGDVEKNLRYLRACLRDCLDRGEAPFASHALYTQPGVLDDDIPEQRARGIEAGLTWSGKAHMAAVYTDLGISTGMRYAMDYHARNGMPVEIRSLGGEWDEA
jgi:hypothetical protein